MSKFTPFDLEICVDSYVFDITITYLYVQKPMGQCADSDVCLSTHMNMCKEFIFESR